MMQVSVLRDKQPFLRGAEFFNPAPISDAKAEEEFATEWLDVRARLVESIESCFAERLGGDCADFVVQDWPSKSRKDGTGSRCIELTFMEDAFLDAEMFSRIIRLLRGLNQAYRLTVFRDTPDDVCGGMIFFYADHAEIWCERETLLNCIEDLLVEGDKRLSP